MFLEDGVFVERGYPLLETLKAFKGMLVCFDQLSRCVLVEDDRVEGSKHEEIGDAKSVSSDERTTMLFHCFLKLFCQLSDLFPSDFDVFISGVSGNPWREESRGPHIEDSFESPVDLEPVVGVVSVVAVLLAKPAQKGDGLIARLVLVVDQNWHLRVGELARAFQSCPFVELDSLLGEIDTSMLHKHSEGLSFAVVEKVNKMHFNNDYDSKYLISA